MKRGFDELEFDNPYPPSIVWHNKDIVSNCISKFLTLDEKSKLSQTCRRLYTIFNQNDQSIRFMCNLYRIREFTDLVRKNCIIGSGILECIQYMIEKMNVLYLECLKEICKSGLFQHEDVISYLTLTNTINLKNFKKILKSSFEYGFIDFTCSFLENRNSKWFSNTNFNFFKIENSGHIEMIRNKIWESLIVSKSVEEIKKYESVLKKDMVDINLLLLTLYNDDINVFGYFWDQASILVRTCDYTRLSFRNEIGDSSNERIVYILNCFFKDNPNVDLDYMLEYCEEIETLKYLIEKK